MGQQYSLEDLLTLMARLREPGYGCPWDLAQTYQTIAPSTLEEAYEVVDAIEHQDYSQLKEELGDLLFQVVFYSQLGSEQKLFDFNQIVSGITAKLLRRHPHVFPEGTLSSRIEKDDSAEATEQRQAEIKATWERIKQEERAQKGNHGIMDDIPNALPAAVRATKLQKRAASVGFDWNSVDGIYLKLDEEIQELQEATAAEDEQHIVEELGDLLFTVINLARHLKVEPETALRSANNKFERRFRELERRADDHQQSLKQQTPETLEAWWQASKELSSKV